MRESVRTGMVVPRGKRDVTAAHTGELGSGKVEIEGRASLGGARDEQRVLRVGNFQLRAEAALVPEGGQIVGFAGLGGVLLPGTEGGRGAHQLVAGARGLGRAAARAPD